jgi:hypothetical protein
MLLLALVLGARSDPDVMGLNPEDISLLNDAELDAYIGRRLGHSHAAPSFESLPPLADSEIDVTSFSLPGLLIDKNADFEDSLVRRRALATPAPLVTSKPGDSRPQRRRPGSRDPLRLIHVQQKPKPWRNHVDYDSMDEDDYYHYGAPYRDDYEYDYEYDMSAQLDKEEPFHDRLTDTIQWARPSFTVAAVAPDSCSYLGRVPVALKIEPKATGNCYCRFDGVAELVRGVLNESGWAVCRAPPREPGESGVSFSKDARNWFGPVPFKYEVPNGLQSLMLFVPAGMAIAAVLALGVWGLTLIAQTSVAGSKANPGRHQFLPRNKKR